MTKKVISGITHALSLMTKRKSSYDRYFQKGNKTDVRSYLKKRYEFLPKLPQTAWRTLGKISKKGLKVLVSKMDKRIALSFTNKQINDRLDHVDAIRASVGLRPYRRNTRLIIQELYFRRTPEYLEPRYKSRPVIRMVEDPVNPDYLVEDRQLSRVYRIGRKLPVKKVPVTVSRKDMVDMSVRHMMVGDRIHIHSRTENPSIYNRPTNMQLYRPESRDNGSFHLRRPNSEIPIYRDNRETSIIHDREWGRTFLVTPTDKPIGQVDITLGKGSLMQRRAARMKECADLIHGEMPDVTPVSDEKSENPKV